MSHDSGKSLWDNHPPSSAIIDHDSVIVTTTDDLFYIRSKHNCLNEISGNLEN